VAFEGAKGKGEKKGGKRAVGETSLRRRVGNVNRPKEKRKNKRDEKKERKERERKEEKRNRTVTSPPHCRMSSVL